LPSPRASSRPPPPATARVVGGVGTGPCSGSHTTVRTGQFLARAHSRLLGPCYKTGGGQSHAANRREGKGRRGAPGEDRPPPPSTPRGEGGGGTPSGTGPPSASGSDNPPGSFSFALGRGQRRTFPTSTTGICPRPSRGTRFPIGGAGGRLCERGDFQPGSKFICSYACRHHGGHSVPTAGGGRGRRGAAQPGHHPARPPHPLRPRNRWTRADCSPTLPPEASGTFDSLRRVLFTLRSPYFWAIGLVPGCILARGIPHRSGCSPKKPYSWARRRILGGATVGRVSGIPSTRGTEPLVHRAVTFARAPFQVT